MTGKKKRILIVGGVAAGASCATRARRLCENCDIVLFDRGPYVSFANCGLPYFVGDVITAESKLLVATPTLFKERFNIEVRTETEVTAIDRNLRCITVQDLKTGEERREGYDVLVLATGARPILPPLDGVDLPGIYVLRSIPDSRKVREAVAGASSAVVVGGGFIGLEMAENLVARGLAVTLLELGHQVLPPLDPEMAHYAAERLRANGVQLRTGEAVAAFSRGENSRLRVETSKDVALETDLVILGIGVRPESSLAAAAGLELGSLGGVRVDESMRTSDPHIWAVGDVVEIRNLVTGEWQLLPLAGPANRQGRIAASNIVNDLGACDSGTDLSMRFEGVLGTAVCEIFGLTVAATGASEKVLHQIGVTEFEKVYLHPGNHASYFPGATPIHLKLLFSTADGRILGAQAAGENGVAHRIDVIATAMRKGASVYDLEELELCYAPQFGAAKDPVNQCGMVAANHLRGDLPLADWNLIDQTEALILDVRSASEFSDFHIPAAVNIPLEDVRAKADQLPLNREIWVVCGVGQRAYYALRTLSQLGFKVKALSGGMQTFRTLSTTAN